MHGGHCAQLQAALVDPEPVFDVVPLGDRGFASDGLGATNDSVLLFTDLEGSGIHMAEQGPWYNTSLTTVVSDSEAMVWPDTLGFDHQGNVLFTSNHLYLYVEGKLNTTGINFRIYSISGLDAFSYLANIYPPSSDTLLQGRPTPAAASADSGKIVIV